MRQWQSIQRRTGRAIALVPTMGYLHEGHLSLIRQARLLADAVVVSIFVNPTQFGPNEDYSRYPRDFDRDEKRCRETGAEVVFYPEAADIYPPGHSVYVIEENLSRGLCGTARPGHFRGVTTVVTILLNVVQPDIAVFGEKDAQQLRIIRRMVRDLHIPVKIISGPIAREPDGLAMSSRNVRLTPEERRQAASLHAALTAAAAAFNAGEHDPERLTGSVRSFLIQYAPLGEVDYIELVDDETLEPVKKIDRKALLALAVNFPSARLIDNHALTP
jgi:pantoate--beta-alanine ligase